MKTNQPNAVQLSAYTVPDFLVENIDLNVNLYDEKAVIRSVMRINRNQMSGKHQRPLILNGETLKLLSIKLNNIPLAASEYQYDEKTLTLLSVPDSFELEIETEIYPQKNLALSGLYRSGELFCTQCEAEGFRRITYYLDRPDVMAPFTTTISANKQKYPILLSNGNLIDKGEQGDRHWVKWQDPFKKPAYLFALVAGDLAQINDHFVTASGRKIELAIYVEKQNIHKCQYAMESLKHSMKWDEEKYGREYDLDIYMIVAVNDFNMGAMENKGLNVFNSKYVLADMDTATDADFMGVEMVIGHEYFHNWTGNRVTLRDWFQLSLKEGLTVFREQQFSQDMGSTVVKRIDDVRQIRTRQFAEDSGPMAHPVRPDSYIEINNFYTMTIYYKGAEVIRMLHTMLGEYKFRKGMDLYFQRHDGQAVTIEHLVNAMHDANLNDTQIDFNQFMNWYTQAGTPRVHVTQQQNTQDGSIVFKFVQTCPPTPGQETKKPFLIPIKINLYEENAKKINLSNHPRISQTEAGDYFILAKSEDELIIENASQKIIPSLLGDFSAPVKLEYAYEERELAFIIKHDEDGFNRWDKSQELSCALIEKLLASSDTSFVLPDIFKETYQEILSDEKTDPALLAQLIALPSFYYIAENLPSVDVEKLNKILSHLRQAIAAEFKEKFMQIYERCAREDNGDFESKCIGYRALKNVCLGMLGRVHDEKVIALIETQYRKAKNMTDRIGALWAINHSTHAMRQVLLDEFYEKYQSDNLVVDKWFALQAQSELPNTLEKIQALMQHKAFDMKNPNKIYALLRTFGASNPMIFHEPNGKGYQFLAEQVIRLNQDNPQVAARILEPLTQWKKLDKKHAELMKRSLELIKKQEKLSEDVYEIVSKSLI